MQIEYFQMESAEKTAMVLPCKTGDLLWYIHGGEIFVSKVYEVRYSASTRGHCGEDFIAFAWAAREGRMLTWCPISEEGWLDTKDEYVPVFQTLEAARKFKEEQLWKTTSTFSAAKLS